MDSLLEDDDDHMVVGKRQERKPDLLILISIVERLEPKHLIKVIDLIRESADLREYDLCYYKEVPRGQNVERVITALSKLSSFYHSKILSSVKTYCSENNVDLKDLSEYWFDPPSSIPLGEYLTHHDYYDDNWTDLKIELI